MLEAQVDQSEVAGQPEDSANTLVDSTTQNHPASENPASGASASESEVETERSDQHPNMAASMEDVKTSYASLTPTSVDAYLDRIIRQAGQDNAPANPFLALDSEAAAALLLRVATLQQMEPSHQIDPSVLSELTHRVNADPDAAKAYFSERYSDLNKDTIGAELELAAGAIATGEPLSGHQLRILVEKGDELVIADTSEQSEKHALALTELKEELAKRADTLSAIAQDLPPTTDHSPELDSTALSSNNADISVQNDGDKLIVTTKSPDGTETHAEISRPESIKSFLVLLASDSLMGTKNLERMGTEVLRQTIIPWLKSKGVDASFLLDTMRYDKYEVFDQFLATLSDDQCKQFFAKAVDNGSLFTMLEQCNPNHIKNIFNSDGTKPFGATSLFSEGKHTLTQDLVELMRQSLTSRQRAVLRVPDQASL